MEQEQGKNQPEIKYDWVEPKEGAPEIYGNFLNVSWTLFDVRFSIGQLVPRKEAELAAGFVVEKRGAVTLAWPETKVLLTMLIDLVARYEKVNGEIKPLVIPPSGPIAT